MRILNTQIKKGNVVSIKSRYSPTTHVTVGEVTGFTLTNINLKTDPKNPLSNEYSMPVDWVCEIKKHKDIHTAINYSNEQYRLKPKQ